MSTAGRAGAPCGDWPAFAPARPRPVQALRARKKGEEDGRWQAKGRRQGKEDERGKEAASDRGWGRGAAGEASAGLKVERANDVQRVESLAERINRLAGKETRKVLQNYPICVARNND